jgi:hypothetical protein
VRRLGCAVVASATAAVIAVGLLALEVAVRFALDEHEANGNYWGIGAFEGDPGLGYVHAAGYEGVAGRRRTFRFRVRISEHHFRQANVDEQLAFPQRVLVLGDSFPFGVGVAEEEAFPSLLQKELNAAQSGYSSTQESLLGRRLLDSLDPDLVLLCVFPGNDPLGDYYRDHERIAVRYGYRLSTRRLFPIAPVDYLRTHSRLWMVLEERVRRATRQRQKRWAEFDELALSDPDRALEATFEAIDALGRACDDREIGLAAVVIPRGFAETPLYGPITEHLKSLGTPYLDLSECGFTDRDYFGADWHWTADGHERAARCLTPFLTRQLAELPGD